METLYAVYAVYRTTVLHCACEAYEACDAIWKPGLMQNELNNANQVAKGCR